MRKWKIAQSTSATHKSLTLLQFRRWRWATNFSVQRSAKDNSRTMSMVQGRLAMNFFVQGSTKDEPWTMNTVQGRWAMNFFVQGSTKDEPWTLNMVQGRWDMNFFVQGSTKDEPWTLNMVQGRWRVNDLFSGFRNLAKQSGSRKPWNLTGSWTVESGPWLKFRFLNFENSCVWSIPC